MATQRFQVVFDFAVRNPVCRFSVFRHREFHLSGKRQRQVSCDCQFFPSFDSSDFSFCRHKFEYRGLPVLFQKDRIAERSELITSAAIRGKTPFALYPTVIRPSPCPESGPSIHIHFESGETEADQLSPAATRIVLTPLSIPNNTSRFPHDPTGSAASSLPHPHQRVRITMHRKQCAHDPIYRQTVP